MLWFAVAALAVVAVLALLLVLVVFAFAGDIQPDEHTLIEVQTRRAERQLHDIAREGFAAMLEAARTKVQG